MQEKIINKAREGDQKAHRAIFDCYARQMFLLCLRYVKIQEDAEDLLSTGFTKAFANLDSFEARGIASFEAWLKRILINECLMFLRKQNKAPLMVEPDETLISTHEDIMDTLSADTLFELILHLPEGYRTVFNLYEIEGYSHKEIAEKMGVTVGTSKSQLSKAKAVLKEMIIKKGLNYAS
ncbi:RNA polymerase sigma-70 factor, ECF subfamily [Algoriphagus faecimaris]|uniref:RNA polymerase sigma-70 factor, ECF subfamily n=1 Tax=Algoriphagus faecimaris TaxID=686796 RepID=A0A1G6MRL1_9BACT|nr:sigma-70 family RNA polymerase sigma factor [Algoriphagus faecimaris]SDC58180.1 RNA polymerase sigma-70 factor, ECF subfamily [Algoriphagus faecimaris]